MVTIDFGLMATVLGVLGTQAHKELQEMLFGK